MIERTAFDLRIAAHQTTTTAINATAWRHEQHRTFPLRAPRGGPGRASGAARPRRAPRAAAFA